MQLADSFSVFFHAFRSTSDDFLAEDAIWRRSDIGPDKDYFFSYVHDFFTGNQPGHNRSINESCTIIYELRKDKLNDEQKDKLMLLNQFFPRVLMTGDERIKFRMLLDGSVLSPKIFYNALTGVGILYFTFAIAESNNSLQALQELNHLVRTFGRKNYNIFVAARNTHEAAAAQEERVADRLHVLGDDHIRKDKFTGYHQFSIGMLVKLLMNDKAAVTLSPDRLQVLTYAQLQRRIGEPELQLASFRLRRIYNDTYLPHDAFLKNSDEAGQMFDQIHFGASIEGCAVVVNEDFDKLPQFLKDYDAVVRNRLMWSYILAYYQRLVLIEMNGEVTRIYDGDQPQKETLFKLLSDLSKIQLKTFFPQISYYTQHNEFYDFCKRNLKLDEMLSVLKDKLTDIGRILQQQVNEAEKVREKRREKKDRVLEIMIAMLLIPEIVFEFLSMLEHVFEINFPFEDHHVFTYILFSFSLLLMLTLVPFAIRIYREYYHAARSYFRKEEPDEDTGVRKGAVDKHGF